MWLCPWLSEGPFRSNSALWATSGGFNSQEMPNSPPAIGSLASTDLPQLGQPSRSGPLSPRSLRRVTTLRRGGGTRIEMPWWIYSSRGMQLLFPSTLTHLPTGSSALGARGSGAAGAPHMHLDQELQFDREVFPIGVSLADAAIIGVSQRLHRAPYAAPRPAPRARKVCPRRSRPPAAPVHAHLRALLVSHVSAATWRPCSCSRLRVTPDAHGRSPPGCRCLREADAVKPAGRVVASTRMHVSACALHPWPLWQNGQPTSPGGGSACTHACHGCVRAQRPRVTEPRRQKAAP